MKLHIIQFHLVLYENNTKGKGAKGRQRLCKFRKYKLQVRFPPCILREFTYPQYELRAGLLRKSTIYKCL